MKKYDYNLEVLEHWSPGLAYVLGLALTDGSVRKDLIRISFYSTDQQMLEIVRDFFQSTRPVVPHSRPEKALFQRRGVTYTGKKQMYAFYIDSKRAVERFCQFGVTPNKSSAGPYPAVPRDVWWHYFRGILDGDGNILFSRKAGLRISIAGNKNCILGLQSDLAELFYIHSQTAYLDEDQCKYLYVSGENAERSLTLTYQDSENLRLERKYHQWLDWNQHFKLRVNCLLCEVPLRASKGEKLCPACRIIRQRLMNRRSDHYRRKGVWLSLRDLCKPEEWYLPVERLDRYGEEMRRVEQHVIEKTHPHFQPIDEMALASKNLWNLANYHVRQAFIFQHTYLNNTATFHRLKATDAYKALPAKVANQVLLQLHGAWTAFFEAMEQYREHPERFRGRPGRAFVPAQNAGAQTARSLSWDASGKQNCACGRLLSASLGALGKRSSNRTQCNRFASCPKQITTWWK